MNTKELIALARGSYFVCESIAEPVDAQVLWLEFLPPCEGLLPVEGKIYIPRQSNGQLVHWSPGFPGGHAGRAEKKYAAALISAGYALSTHRFNGTSLIGPEAVDVINCSERIALAIAQDERHIGGTKPNGWPITSVLLLPATVLSTLGCLFENIITIGHSMGATANYQSVSWLNTHAPDMARKVTRMISLAGYTGHAFAGKEANCWDGMRMPVDQLVDYEIERVAAKDVNFPLDREAFKKGLWRVANLNQSLVIPPETAQILQFSEHDPLIPPPGPMENRGPHSAAKEIIVDHRGAEDKAPHSMLWITPEEMLERIQAQLPAGHHYRTIR